MMRHGKELGVVQANHDFANEQVDTTKKLMLEDKINTAQDDVGHPFRRRTRTVAIVSSWTRPSNNIMVSSVDEMMPVNMTLDQILRAGCNNLRVCISVLVLGLIASAFTTSVNGSDMIAPLIVDMIPAMNEQKDPVQVTFARKMAASVLRI